MDEVVTLLSEWGVHRYDEVVSQLDHALQTAALARRDAASDELVAAALLHDVGHLLDLRDRAGEAAIVPGGVSSPGTASRNRPHGARTGPGTGDLRHEERGAVWLSAIFPAAVTAPIALHVAAKRYRCAMDPTEADRLSFGSVASLERQGGPMSPDEVAAFESLAGHVDAVTLRGWDDAGKVDGLRVEPLETYRSLLSSLATA